MKILRALGLLLASALATASFAVAQNGPGVTGHTPAGLREGADHSNPSVFGTSGTDISTLGWNAFYPEKSAGYASITGTSLGGYRWTTDTDSFMTAPMPEIPNGALLTQVVWYVNDSSATVDFTGYVCRYWRESNLGGSPGGDCFSTLTTTGAPGDTEINEGLNHTVLRRTDPVGDSVIRVINYVLYTNTAAFDGSVKFGEVRLLWRRQVSPAPATATFLDVPVGAPQAPFVEALVRAGITAGCGGGNYCPNQAVTRGQMAVFMAVALGLHWPAF